MFAATPRLRDFLDLRSVPTIAIVALVAFGLQLGLLAGLFASPLGEAIANLDAAPRVEGAPEEALAAGARTAGPGDDTDGARLVSDRPPRVEHRPVPASCVVSR